MDDIVNSLARELSDAIAAVVAVDPQVEAVRERARAAGFELQVSLEAVIGFMNRTHTELARTNQPAKPGKPLEVSSNDKRFLRSLRIAAEDDKDKEVE